MEQVKLGLGASTNDILGILATSPDRGSGADMAIASRPREPSVSGQQKESEMARLRQTLSWLEKINDNGPDFAEIGLGEGRPQSGPSPDLSRKNTPGGASSDIPISPPASAWVGAEVHHTAESKDKEVKIVKEGW